MKAQGPTVSLLTNSWFRLLLVLGLAVGAFGCSPKIGGQCATSTDCSVSGDRLCDITQPSGYCTVFNCEPNLCPDDAACVAYGEGTCSSSSVSTRFRRTFCMATCESDSDCRSGGYKCIDISHDPSRWVVDVDPPNRHICAVPSSIMSPATPPDPAVCYPSDASFDVSRPEAGSTSDAADATDGASSDATGDPLDATVADRVGRDAVDDTTDSSRGETGADVVTDTSDEAQESGATDSSDEWSSDGTTHDAEDADGSTDASDVPDAAAD